MSTSESSLDSALDGSALDAETLVQRVIGIIDSTRALPLSSSVKLDNKDEILELLHEACHRMPDEFRQARWMVKERDEFLHKTHREAADILEAGRLRAERMVQRTQIVREAEYSARRILEQAEEHARQLRLEAEDYCDQKLAAFEVVLQRTARTVSAGRERLAATPAAVVSAPDGQAAAESDDDTLADSEAFFDQDSR